MEPVKSFSIDRKTWFHGQCGSRLLCQSDNKRCCLGFYLNACGLSDAEIADKSTPLSVFYENPNSVPDWLIEQIGLAPIHTEIALHLMDVNDRTMSSAGIGYIMRTEREAKITELFAQAGITVTFTGEY